MGSEETHPRKPQLRHCPGLEEWTSELPVKRRTVTGHRVDAGRGHCAGSTFLMKEGPRGLLTDQM